MVDRRITGSFYTCDYIADYIVKWAIRTSADSILEPSFGDGVFIDCAQGRYHELGNSNPQIYAVELQPEPFEKISKSSLSNFHGFCQDFITFDEPILVDAAIGNPPYIRLKNLSCPSKELAVGVAEDKGIEMLTSGSLWMPFLIHAIDFLKLGGRIGFVLPFELTYVKYAYPLWEYLKKNFGKISIYRVHEDLFPDVNVETILFLADDFGGSTSYVEYSLYGDRRALFDNFPQKTCQILIDDILKGKKPFVWELLNTAQQMLIEDLRQRQIIVPISTSCKFRIGYVCADKRFFHPSLDVIRDFRIPPENLTPCIPNSKAINGGTNIGITLEDGQCASMLYIPRKITKGDKDYLDYGVATDVDKKYKCRIRKPWYVTPGVERADLILTVFGDAPKLVGNKGCYAVSNSLLSGTLIGELSIEEMLCRWYNSLTLLSIELNVHSLGGGVLVLIPGEADKIEIVADFPKESVAPVIEQMNRRNLSEGLTATYSCGDEIVLKKVLGLSNNAILAIREALETLQSWRRPSKRK